MSYEELTKALSGEVTDIFAHRFVLKTADGKVLADLGPEGAEQVLLKEGDRVELEGELKPSEIKVHSIAKNGGPLILVHPPLKPHPHDHEEADPGPALKTAEANGFTVLGKPRRKPKHFEIFWAAIRRATSSSCTSSWTARYAKPVRCTKTIPNGERTSRPGVNMLGRAISRSSGAFHHG